MFHFFQRDRRKFAFHRVLDALKFGVENRVDIPTDRARFVWPLVKMKELTSTLGLFRIPVAEESEQNDALVEPLMNLLIDLRRNAKKNKDFATADEIRNRLKDLGITLEDRPGGVCVWSKETK